MNERHPSGYVPDYGAYAYDAYSQGGYPAAGTAFADDTATGAYSAIPQQDASYGYDPQTGHTPAQGVSYGTGCSYDLGQQQSYDPYGYPAGATYYDTGTYDASQFTGYQQQPAAPEQTGTYPQQDWDSGAYPAYGYGYDTSGDTGIYEQFPPQQQYAQGYEQQPQGYPQPQQDQDPYAAHGYDAYPQAAEPYADPVGPDAPAGLDELADLDALDALGLDTPGLAPEPDPAFAERHDYAADGDEPGLPTARSRRRKPAKRSALLTVAVPSVAVMGVAAVGAAAVTGVGVAQDSGGAHTDAAGGTAPTTQLDRQLAGVSADADDFADRASRTQERIDLKDRQEAAKKAAAEAAARKEALRPKFVLPVKQHGLSAYFGQAGVNWMALHTGIDFPVVVGTPVMAVTDGTVRTQWNSSYGNMAIVTAPDGTETWYCHLSSTKIRSGKVKAGTVIAYSGNTGNTTGPHLHLEVRPNGGSPIDPLPWLLKHGLDPR
ncbi:M23 family metallopeptidase [Actinacidiphila epipremni]|nr:M23 family metallopeptidase [Actinacidiphila epipremni]